MISLGVLTYNTEQPLPMSTIASVIYEGAPAFSYQRKSFYANGRFWVFWSNGRQAAGDFNILYSTSINGIIWTSPIIIRPCINSTMFSIWFDNTYVHYAYADKTKIYYRRGIPNVDGTITWSAAEQVISTTYNRASFPMVSIDSNGYVWVGYLDWTGASGSGYYAYVIKSGNNNGTWGITPSGFPYRCPGTSVNVAKATVIPLTLGKVLIIYCTYMNRSFRSQYWNGSTWSGEKALSSVPYGTWAHSAVAEGDDVHLTFLQKTTYNIQYAKYTYAIDSWSTEETIQIAATSQSDPVLCRDIISNNLYCFWFKSPDSNTIYYKKRINGTWDSNPITWITDILTLSDNRLNCFYNSYSGKIGIMYCSKTTSPFDLRFTHLII